MNNKYLKYTLLAIIMVISSVNIMAQSGVPYRIFDIQTDIKSQSLGGTYLVSGSNNYIYGNPTHLFRGEKPWAISLTGQFLPKYDGMTREQYGSASMGYRLNNKHALFLGVRYLNGGKIEKIDALGEETGKEINPTQLAVDLGYAYALDNNWSAFATVTMLRANDVRDVSTVFAGVGVSYFNSIELFSGKKTDVEASLAVSNIGDDISYDNNMSYQLPSTISFGAGATTAINENHSVGLKSQIGYITSNSTTQVGVGLEYSYHNLFSLRGGYNHLDDKVNFATAGFSIDCLPVTVEASYMIGLNEYTKNTLALGVSFKF